MWWNTIAEGCIDMINMCNYRNMVEDYRIWSKSAPMLVSLYKLRIKRQVDPREKNGGGSSSWPVLRGTRGNRDGARFSSGTYKSRYSSSADPYTKLIHQAQTTH